MINATPEFAFFDRSNPATLQSDIRVCVVETKKIRSLVL